MQQKTSGPWRRGEVGKGLLLSDGGGREKILLDNDLRDDGTSLLKKTSHNITATVAPKRLTFGDSTSTDKEKRPELGEGGEGGGVEPVVGEGSPGVPVAVSPLEEAPKENTKENVDFQQAADLKGSVDKAAMEVDEVAANVLNGEVKQEAPAVGKGGKGVREKGEPLVADVRKKKTSTFRRRPQCAKVGGGEKNILPPGSRKRGHEEGSGERDEQKRTKIQEEFVEEEMEEPSEMAGLHEQPGRSQ